MFSQGECAHHKHNGVVAAQEHGHRNAEIVGGQQSQTGGPAAHQLLRDHEGAYTDGHEDVSGQHQKQLHDPFLHFFICHILSPFKLAKQKRKRAPQSPLRLLIPFSFALP